MTRLRSIGWMTVALASALLAVPERAVANFHFWEIVEVYSNADGSVQYIEFSTTFGGQGVLGGHILRATSDGVVRNFSFPGDLSGPTANQRFLVATPGFASLPGAVAPDYVLDCGPFFDPAAASITIDLIGADALTFAKADLPTDGSNALHATTAGVVSVGTNTPTNFAGDAGALALLACLVAGTCEPCDDGLFCNGAETCSAFACVPGLAPCGSLCDEAANSCVECFGPADCNDATACTADSCEGGACVFTPIAGSCDDGQFCTSVDSCADGVCVGAGSPCGEQNCIEDADICAECAQASDCEDGNACTIDDCVVGRCTRIDAEASVPCNDDDVFCNGAGVCGGGTCQSAGNPCNPLTHTCNEDDALCVPIPEPGNPAGIAALVALTAIARARAKTH